MVRPPACPRECLDDVVVTAEASLRRTLTAYARYYNEVRTHRSLGKDVPQPRPIKLAGTIGARPVLGGLHHHRPGLGFWYTQRDRRAGQDGMRQLQRRRRLLHQLDRPGRCRPRRLDQRHRGLAERRAAAFADAATILRPLSSILWPFDTRWTRQCPGQSTPPIEI
jgi:hypothetical protein